jgi:transketolase
VEEEMNLKALSAVANSVRTLSMDAVEKAKSGHPGLPLGAAELGALLYGEIMKHDPADPDWADRDRFILSAGHGCMLLYSLLHLSGYALSLDDLKSFRQMGSRTPGHPEKGVTPGVEATAGPLGQGIANGVGMAIAERILAAKFNTPRHSVVDHYTYVLAGDGCMMEGVSAEAASLAGHLGLGKLIVFYDSNHITIEGSTDLAFSEDVLARFASYGWHTGKGSMYDLEGIDRLTAAARAVTDKPSIILLESVIAKGAPNKAGSHKAHGEPLGADEITAARKALGIPEDASFHVFPEAAAYFKDKQLVWKARHEEWKKRLAEWKQANPALAAEWQAWMEKPAAALPQAALVELPAAEAVATRAAGGKVLNALAKVVPNLIGGSADLAPSNNTNLAGLGDFTRSSPSGRNFHFGIREHGMGAAVNGIAYHGGLRAFCATFLVFSDYMRPSIRVAALARLPVIYVFTHDSIFVGEDGPTHEPVEHLAALRAIPNLLVLRPADAEETEAAWRMAYEKTDGPSMLALTRQALPILVKADADWRKTIRRGAYVVKDCTGAPELVVVATGSEVHAAVKAAEELAGRRIRVVSMACRELFAAQAADFRDSLVPPSAKVVVFEAGVSLGWKGPFDRGITFVGMESFGESGPAQKVAEHFGITAAALKAKLGALLA